MFIPQGASLTIFRIYVLVNMAGSAAGQFSRPSGMGGNWELFGRNDTNTEEMTLIQKE